MPSRRSPEGSEQGAACSAYIGTGHPCRSGLLIYDEYEGKSYCILHFPGPSKQDAFNQLVRAKLDAEDFDFEGAWFPESLSFKDLRFSKETNFCDATFAAEADFSGATFLGKTNFRLAKFKRFGKFEKASFNEQTDFSGATFGEPGDAAIASFVDATFAAEVDFSACIFTEEAAFWNTRFGASAQFSFAKFLLAGVFSGASFGGLTDFTKAEFLAARADFCGATFSALKFTDAKLLGETVFYNATFTAPADFSGTAFGPITTFATATFKDYVRFSGKLFPIESSVDFQFLRTEKPDHVSVHTATLRPRWFINADTRKFDFTAIRWLIESLDQDLVSLREKQISSPERLLAKTYREIAVNCEENHYYENASKFRYLAMDVLRKAQLHGFAFWRLDWWYWAVSGFGERISRAFVSLVGIWIVFAFLYTQVGFSPQETAPTAGSTAANANRNERAQPLNFERALTYSLAVIALQKPDPRPSTTAAHALVTLETILGPLQAALLALAIRRQFMR